MLVFKIVVTGFMERLPLKEFVILVMLNVLFAMVLIFLIVIVV